MAPDSTTQAAGTDLPADVVADILAAPRRQRLLELLASHDGPMILGTVAAHVAAAEDDVAPPEVPERRRLEVREDLYQEHLPKLTATGVVAYDSMVDTVELRRPDILEAQSD